MPGGAERPGAGQAADGRARPGSRPADQRPPSGPAPGSPSKLLSPVVRRLISEHGLDPTEIPGSGAGGRITRDDVLAAVERQATNGSGTNGTGSGPGVPATAAPATAADREAVAPAATRAVTAGPVPVAGAGDTVVPFTNIRRRTAEHMVRSILPCHCLVREILGLPEPAGRLHHQPVRRTVGAYGFRRARAKILKSDSSAP